MAERDDRARARQHRGRVEPLGEPARHPVHVGGVPGRQPRRERRRIERLGGRQPDQRELAGARGRLDGLGGEHGAAHLAQVWAGSPGDVNLAKTVRAPVDPAAARSSWR